MKAFFLAFLVVVTAATLYVTWHIWRLVPSGWFLRLSIVGIFLLWTASFFFGFFFLESVPYRAAIPLYQIGNTWLIAFLYIFLAFFLLDILSVCGALPKGFLKDSWPVLGGIAGAITLLLCVGGLHYHHKYREELTITTSKPLEKPLTVVLASDLHLGYHNRQAELGRWIDLFNAENPDLVLIGGDIVDRSLRPVLRDNYSAEFKRLKAPIWSILGNHEYYSGLDYSKSFFKEAGIGLLQDSFIDTLGVRIVGRNDRTDPCRPALWEILPKDDDEASDSEGSLPQASIYPDRARSAASLGQGLPQTEPFTILLDHQPNHLEEAEEAGVDFQFSGHTHRGQVWPISWITDALYEKSWGHLQKGDTHYYISSGLGIWGAKIRIGTRSEYLVLHINSK